MTLLRRNGWRLTLLFPLALSVFAASGCASIFTGTKQNVRLTSHPVRAFVEIRDENDEPIWAGHTPTTVSLPRKRGYVLEARIEGYHPAEARIDTELNGWFFANLLFGLGAIPAGLVDYTTGAMWNLDPEYISFDLVPSEDHEGGDEDPEEYMVLLIRALDREGRARQLALPLVRQTSVAN